jgi:hypothetical protein
MNKLEEKKHDLVFQARMNIIYHEKSEEFFSKFINWTAFISVLFSSAAITDVIPWIENSKLLIAFFSIVVTMVVFWLLKCYIRSVCTII